MRKLAIIGGTGVYDPAFLNNTKTTSIKTPYGDAVYTSGTFMDKEIIFMTRHGANHTIPPHKINYRANIYALKMLDVVAIVATTAVGSLNPDMKPGEMVLVDQLLDFTKSREHTFYDGSPLPVFIYLRHAEHGKPVYFSKLLQFRTTHHRSIVCRDFTNHSGRI